MSDSIRQRLRTSAQDPLRTLNLDALAHRAARRRLRARLFVAVSAAVVMIAAGVGVAAAVDTHHPATQVTTSTPTVIAGSPRFHFSHIADRAVAVDLLQRDVADRAEVLSASDAYITLTSLGSAWNTVLKTYEPTPPELNPAQAVYVQLVHGTITVLGSKPQVQWLLLVSSDAPGYGSLAETGFNAPSLPSWFDQLPPPSAQSHYIP